MDYQALYRRYRPRRFDEVIGQDHVTRTLLRELVDGSVAHAYLFAGPRGTGKTTTARILAKSLNCPDRKPDGEPCNVCPSCLSIDDGTSLDVIELDAASHNKVEDVREIRVNVGAVASAEGARRIYILDEAHMLSRAAGNALLKTLEEPPEHVIFVLATTEPYKLLDTIRSRTQRFDFHPIGADLLVAHLAAVAAREQYEPASSALAAIAHHARGSVRDALGLLEQVAALGDGAVIERDVTRALGLADREAFRRLVDAVAGNDAAAALTLVAELAGGGADLRRFVADSIGLFRGIFLSQHVSAVAEVADASADEIAEWQRAADRLEPAAVLRAVDLLGDALTALREGRDERLVVELALMRLTRPEVDEGNAALAARLERLERRLTRLEAPGPADQPAERSEERVEEATAVEATVPESTPSAPPADTVESAQAREPESEASATAPEVVDLDLDEVARAWPAILLRMRDEVGMRSHALLREATPNAVEGSQVVFAIPAHLTFHLERLQADSALATRLGGAISEQVGAAVTVAFAFSDGDVSRTVDTPDLIDEDSGPADPEALLRERLGATEIESDPAG